MTTRQRKVLRITSPQFAVRLFDDEAEARTWLLEVDS